MVMVYISSGLAENSTKDRLRCGIKTASGWPRIHNEVAYALELKEPMYPPRRYDEQLAGVRKIRFKMDLLYVPSPGASSLQPLLSVCFALLGLYGMKILCDESYTAICTTG